MISRLLLGWLAATALVCPALADDQPVLQILVSKNKQSLAVYDGTQVIATSRVSTGKPGHDTPTGIFSVLEKQVYHESNLYSAAPMPFMQRLTWSGIALHEASSVPRYPASHGCVRLPASFAKQLYKMTQTGVPVIISDAEVEPIPVDHLALFQADPAPPPLLFSDVILRPSVGEPTGKPVELAMNTVRPLSPMQQPEPVVAANKTPIRILITRRTQRETLVDVQKRLHQLGFSIGPADGLIGDATVQAIRTFKTLRPEIFRGDKSLVNDKLLLALYEATGNSTPPNGAILVRQDFKPLFEEPVEIEAPEEPLGTHFLVLQSSANARDDQEWLGVTLKNSLSPQAMKRLGIRGGFGVAQTGSLENTLTRIAIPKETRQKIAALLSRGATLTISDTGIGTETGNGTDFITLTRN